MKNQLPRAKEGAEEEEDDDEEAGEAEEGDEGEVFVVGEELVFQHGGVHGDELGVHLVVEVAGAGTHPRVFLYDAPGAAPEFDALEHGEARHGAVAAIVFYLEEGDEEHPLEGGAMCIDGVGDAAGNLVDLCVGE